MIAFEAKKYETASGKYWSTFSQALRLMIKISDNILLTGKRLEEEK